MLSEFNSSLSTGEENIMGAGVPSNVEKSTRSRPAAVGKDWGLWEVATVGEMGPSSERVEEMDRRFVRAGVRTWVGGCFCELEEWDLRMDGGGGVKFRRP
jgi:hypothetical protein